MQTRHARQRPQLHVVSAPAKPEVRFAIEPFYVIAKELPPLFRRHWREFGRDRGYVPLDPGWEGLVAQSIAGRMGICAARDGAQLGGYIFNPGGPRLAYSTYLH